MKEDFLKEKLKKQESAGLLRKLRVNESENMIDLASNDYLGFSSTPLINSKAENSFSGSGGSRLLTGNWPIHLELESYIADYFRSENSLLCNSGYTANLALLSSVPDKHDLILYDEKSHASIKDAIRMSKAKFNKFRHNDLDDLERRLQKKSGRVFVVIESVYSMDGSLSKVKQINQLCSRYGAYLIVDEAHSTGLMGPEGAGYCLAEEIENDVFARIMTFGKGVGAHGAAICCSTTVKNYLINFSRPVIYTTAISPQSCYELLERLKKIRLEGDSRRQQLINIIEAFKSLRDESIYKNYFLESSTAIQGLMIKGNQAARLAANLLEENGFKIFPILSPTVPSGEERLRICLHSFNSEKELTKFFSVVKTLDLT